MGQRARYGDTLLLAAGELVRQTIHLVLKADKREREGHAVLDLFGGDVRHTHGERHILIDGHGRDQAEVLKDNTHLTAQIRHLAPADLGQILPIDEYLALGGLLLHLDQLQKGGFACTGVAKDKDKFSLLDMDVDVLQRNIFIVVGLIGFIYMLKIDH